MTKQEALEVAGRIILDKLNVRKNITAAYPSDYPEQIFIFPLSIGGYVSSQELRDALAVLEGMRKEAEKG